MRIEYHRTLIADEVRNAAFEAALKTVIRKDETVVSDIGAGTGLIGLMASKLGAREVNLYEVAEVASVARDIVKANRARNCHLMPCHSTEMQDPPRADVVVSETLGNFAFEEDIIETLNDAVKRHLVPGGVVIPGKLAQYVAPVTSDRFHSELTAWKRVGRGLDLSVAQLMSFNNIYVRTVAPADLLDKGRTARRWDEIDFSVLNKTTRRGDGRWAVEREVTIFGFAAWWVAELVPGVRLSTAPDAPRTHWEQLYFPLMRPIRMQSGETIAVSLRSKSSMRTGTDMAWSVVRTDRAGQQHDRQSMDLSKGYLP